MNRREWAENLIRRGHAAGPVPRYGSRSWCELSATDARLVAAVVIAAECWHDALVRLPERLHDELTAIRQVQDADDDAAFAAAAERVRRMATQPTMAQIKSRWSA